MFYIAIFYNKIIEVIIQELFRFRSFTTTKEKLFYCFVRRDDN